MTLRGQPDEDAVLCTRSKTYAVKFVGTSNSVLLIPPLDQSVSCGDTEDYEKKLIAPVFKVAPGVMELVEVAPRIDKLKTLLSEHPYPFDEVSVMEEPNEMENSNRGLYGWEDLIDKVQASDEELRSGLHSLSAVEIGGYWRIVDDNYMDGILNMLLHNSVLNDWSLNALNESDVVNVLQSDGFPREIAHHCLRVYGSKVTEGVMRLDEKRVCVHFARRILRGRKMRMDNFMVEWTRKIPDGMQASFDMLEGEVLTEKLGIEAWVYAFSVSSLPSAPTERFSMLFRERPKWEWKDLQPYIRFVSISCCLQSLRLSWFFIFFAQQRLSWLALLFCFSSLSVVVFPHVVHRDLSVPGLSSEGLLLKYTRRTQPTTDAEPVFSAR